METISNELERVLVGNSAAAPPSHILDGVDDELAHRRIPGAPRTIYEELWHIAFWQQVSLKWIDGIATLYPEHASAGFPTSDDIRRESWEELCRRFLAGNEQSGAIASDGEKLGRVVRCPSAPGLQERAMTVREQLESLAAHNAYHFGRIVLLRQIGHSWPPASGGDTW